MDVLEYVDAYEMVLVAIAKRQPGEVWPPDAGSMAVELERIPNRTGICPAVVPGRISLDRQMGMVDNFYGRFIKMAKLDALEYVALKKQIFAKEFYRSHPGDRVRVDREPIPHLGQTGLIHGGTLDRQSMDPTLLVTNNIVDRYEQNSRVDSNSPAQFGGENPTNVRTGRASAGLIAASTDFHIQEHQEILARSKMEEIKRGVKMQKAFGGDTKRSFFVGWKGVRSEVTYTSADLYTDTCHVSYPLPGVDAREIPSLVGGMMGLGMMSRDSALEINPLVQDPEHEKDFIIKEAIEAAVLGFIQARTQMPPEQGGIDLDQLIAITESVAENKQDLLGALKAAQDKAREAQAAQAAAQAGTPQSQPGIGGAAPLVQEQVAGPMDELSQMLFSLRSSSRGAQAA